MLINIEIHILFDIIDGVYWERSLSQLRVVGNYITQPLDAALKEYFSSNAIQYAANGIQNCRMCTHSDYGCFIEKYTIFSERVPGGDFFLPKRSS